MTSPRQLDAIVLAGGAASRLGGRDKLALDVGGIPLLRRVLAAVAEAECVVIVGPPRPGLTDEPGLLLTREDPAGGGPAAAIAAGLRLISAPRVAVLAGDLPFVTAGLVRVLADACPPDGGAVLVDDRGRRQHLVGVWAAAALRDAVVGVGETAGVAAARLFEGLDVVEVSAPHEGALPWLDCDTDDDLIEARRHA